MPDIFNSSCPQNTQNSVVPPVSLDFVDIAHTSETVEKVLFDVRQAGIVLTVKDGLLVFDAPKGVLTEDLRNRIRLNRERILLVVCSGACPSPRDTSADLSASGAGPDQCDLWDAIQSGNRVNGNPGFDEAIFVDLQFVPLCKQCQRLSDSITATNEWACSRCEPQRAIDTARLLRLKDELLARSGPRWSPPIGQTDYLDVLLSDMKVAGSDADRLIIADPSIQTPCPKCRSTHSYLAVVHNGETLRRDCSGCGKYIDNPVWRNPVVTSEFIQGLLSPVEQVVLVESVP